MVAFSLKLFIIDFFITCFLITMIKSKTLFSSTNLYHSRFIFFPHDMHPSCYFILITNSNKLHIDHNDSLIIGTWRPLKLLITQYRQRTPIFEITGDENQWVYRSQLYVTQGWYDTEQITMFQRASICRNQNLINTTFISLFHFNDSDISICSPDLVARFQLAIRMACGDTNILSTQLYCA